MYNIFFKILYIPQEILYIYKCIISFSRYYIFPKSQARGGIPFANAAARGLLTTTIIRDFYKKKKK